MQSEKVKTLRPWDIFYGFFGFLRAGLKRS